MNDQPEPFREWLFENDSSGGREGRELAFRELLDAIAIAQDRADERNAPVHIVRWPSRKQVLVVHPRRQEPSP